MTGSLPWSTAPPLPPTNDPSEMLRRIDQTTTQLFHWVRLGFVAVIVLLLLIALGL